MIIDFSKASPLRILEYSSRKGLGRGNLGVLTARAGVGKTACLIHIAFDSLFRRKRLAHISLVDVPEKVTSYYNVIFYDLVKALGIEDESELRALMEQNRMILAYVNRSFRVDRLRESLENLAEHAGFKPDTLIVDGLDFSRSGREVLEDFKKLAGDFNTDVWFSAVSHRHLTETNEWGIPSPLSQTDDLFDIILQLLPEAGGVNLNLLKDHDTYGSPIAAIRMDAGTFLAVDESV
ncbi:MAG: hypothetical protein ACQET7_02280 [Thermodesulfobacteriota bacterium]